ncbi:MAG: hypothetical protein HYX68_18440 [Planctomycetes bacterium]|nr:hypothetical protein [Planctomycetota bacterium]
MTADADWNYYYYDHSGRLTKKIEVGTGIAWKYAWNESSKLTQVRRWSEDPDTVGTAILQKALDYKYNAFGLVLEKSLDGSGGNSPVTQRYAYEGANVLADLNGSSSLTTRYLRTDRTNQLLARIDSGVPRWYLLDRLNSTRDVIDATWHRSSTLPSRPDAIRSSGQLARNFY